MALAQPGAGNIYAIRCSCDSTSAMAGISEGCTSTCSRNMEYQYYGVISFRVFVLWPNSTCCCPLGGQQCGDYPWGSPYIITIQDIVFSVANDKTV